MKSYPFAFLILVFGFLHFSCKEPKEQISERWVFTHLQTPASKAMAKAFDPAVLDEMFAELDKKIQGNRLVLEKKRNLFWRIDELLFYRHLELE